MRAGPNKIILKPFRTADRTESGIFTAERSEPTQVAIVEAGNDNYANGDMVIYSRFDVEEIEGLTVIPVSAVYARLR